MGEMALAPEGEQGAKKCFISFFSLSVPAPSHSSTTSCRHADKRSLAAMGYVGGVQRPHVALDDVLFLVGQFKHGFSVVACNTSMLEAVPMGDVAAIMPVVQVKIVQERPLYKAGLIRADVQMDVEPERDAGDAQTVLVGCHAAVLDEFLHFQRVRVIGNAFQKYVHTHFFFGGQFAEHSNSSTRAAVSARGAVPSTVRIGQASCFCHSLCSTALRVSSPPSS